MNDWVHAISIVIILFVMYWAGRIIGFRSGYLRGCRRGFREGVNYSHKLIKRIVEGERE